MKMYKIRKKSTGKYLLSIGVLATGRWHSEGKLYYRLKDVKVAIGHMRRRLRRMYLIEVSLEDDKSLNILEEIELRTNKFLTDLEVVEYNLHISRTFSVEELNANL